MLSNFEVLLTQFLQDCTAPVISLQALHEKIVYKGTLNDITRILLNMMFSGQDFHFKLILATHWNQYLVYAVSFSHVPRINVFLWHVQFEFQIFEGQNVSVFLKQAGVGLNSISFVSVLL